MERWIEVGLFLTLAGAAAAVQGAELRAEVPCPHDTQESCRWEIRASRLGPKAEDGIRVLWDKSIVSRHFDKPLAKPIACNVDREFDFTAGGFLRVWFEGEAAPCDAMTSRDAAKCGVAFVMETYPVGFTVKAPADRKIARVEHYSTLKIQCGDFTRPDFTRRRWASRLVWIPTESGDGFKVENGKPTVE